MKKSLFAFVFFVTTFSLGQKTELLVKFETLNSAIGATIHIVKSKTYKAEIIGDSDVTATIILDLNNSTIKIRSKSTTINYSNILITVYILGKHVLALSNVGLVTMDKDFSRVPTLVVSAEDKAIVDLSNIA